MAAEAGGRRVAVKLAADAAGLRLDRALQRLLPELSRSRLKQLILDGHITSGGKALRDPAQKAGAGLSIVVTLPPPDEAAPAAQAIPLDIRYEDAHLIVLDKPAGMVVHPAPGNPAGTLVNALLAHCGQSLAGIGGVRRPGIVHRLDKDTSGLLVVAKTELAHHALSRDFAARRIERAYTAAVWGAPMPPAGEIAGNIGRSPINRKKMAVVGGSSGKPAVTRYRVERRFSDHAAFDRVPPPDRPDASDPRASGAYRPSADRRSALRRARRPRRHPRREGRRQNCHISAPGSARKITRLLASGDRRASGLRERSAARYGRT